MACGPISQLRKMRVRGEFTSHRGSEFHLSLFPSPPVSPLGVSESFPKELGQRESKDPDQAGKWQVGIVEMVWRASGRLGYRPPTHCLSHTLLIPPRAPVTLSTVVAFRNVKLLDCSSPKGLWGWSR